MKKIFVIGSAVVDVVVRLPHLPGKSEDVHVRSQAMQLGGCGFNVYDMIRHFEIPSIPFFPIGTGAYGEFVRAEFSRRHIPLVIPSAPAENGCCYCFVEDDGERTFLSYHGAEYRFDPSWFDLLRPEEIGSVYFCGLEIEEDTGIHVISFLTQLKKAHPEIRLFFAPGPRICRISPDRLEKLFALGPLIHLNETEVTAFTQTEDILTAARKLQHMTGSDVIVTLGKDGCLCVGSDSVLSVPGYPALQKDTIGAGDAHIGAVIACLHRQMSMEEALRCANRISARVVETEGALLDQDQFTAIMQDT